MEVPEERVLQPAEREVGHRGRDPDVDANVPRADARAELPRLLAARSINRGGVAVRAPVNHLNRVVETICVENGHDGPKDLLTCHGHVGPDFVEDRWADEV